MATASTTASHDACTLHTQLTRLIVALLRLTPRLLCCCTSSPQTLQRIS
jgi:hypothetical protein